MKLLVIGVFFASLGVARAQSPFATAHPTNGVKVAPAAAIKAPPTSALVLPPSNDDCAGALPLTGGGPFVVWSSPRAARVRRRACGRRRPTARDG